MTSQPEKSDLIPITPFLAYAKGPQSWETLTAEVIDGRIHMELDGTAIKLTKIQSEVLVGWLAAQVRHRVQRPWIGRTLSHGVDIDVDAGDVVLRIGVCERAIVFDEAMDVAELLDRAIGQATRNAVDGG